MIRPREVNRAGSEGGGREDVYRRRVYLGKFDIAVVLGPREGSLDVHVHLRLVDGFGLEELVLGRLGGVHLLLKGAEAAGEGRGAAGAVGRGRALLLLCLRLGVGLEVAVGVGDLLAGVAGDGEGRGGEVGARHCDGWWWWRWDRGLFVCFGWMAWELGLVV